MGMFDYLKISTKMLPISDSDKKKLGENPGWQTKDFDCILSTAEITDDGRLLFNKFDYGFDENAVNAFGLKGCLTHVNEHTVEYKEYHGVVNFYTHDKNKDWWEFWAKFTDGKLVLIEGGKETP